MPHGCLYGTHGDDDGEHVYFDLEIFRGDRKLSSLNDFVSCLDQNDCHGMGANLVTKISVDVLSSLKYLHEKDIAHGDLKPANVLVSNHHFREEKDRHKLAIAWDREPVICKLADFG